ncbi:MAG: hypothetical protein NHF94_00930 [Candidatus Bostrichicola ureolyticus]|nr:MAG: hypothetical protein NHF94_00930 [Candidatus Bostrichicola ureolyticus]
MLFSIGFYQNLSITTQKNEIKLEQNISYLKNKIYNRPWSALYIAAFYFTSISLGVLFFLGIQYVSKAGWVIVIIRIMEGIASFIPYGGIIIILILVLNSIGYIHIFSWMDLNPIDKIIINKQPYLNKVFFLIRSIIYLVGWTIFMIYIKNLSKKLDKTHNILYYNKLYKVNVIFLIFFAITSTTMGWDWIMSLDINWISTLFSWYILSSYVVTGITTITLISIYLKNKGYIPLFNNNHLHDLAKYIFATSLLWSYLWFAQYLLYWYGNIPEEVIYFFNRSKEYNNIYLWMLIPNFLIPLLGLISSNIKRNYKVITIIGFIIIIGHYIDIYNMIMPSSVYKFYGFGFLEIGSFLFMMGFFIFIIQKTLIKMEFDPKGNPFFNESKYYKYPY